MKKKKRETNLGSAVHALPVARKLDQFAQNALVALVLLQRHAHTDKMRENTHSKEERRSKEKTISQSTKRVAIEVSKMQWTFPLETETKRQAKKERKDMQQTHICTRSHLFASSTFSPSFSSS